MTPNSKLYSFTDCTRFQRHLRFITDNDPDFAAYLCKNWMHIKRQWAYHAQNGLVHFGNTTNNRLESAHCRLKKHTHASDRLVVAIQKVWDYSSTQISDFHLQAAYASDRRELFEADTYVKNVVCRLTTYAAHRVLSHISRRSLDMAINQLSEFEVWFANRQLIYSSTFATIAVPFLWMWLLELALARSINLCGSRAFT